jgi:hypothetical protein
MPASDPPTSSFNGMQVAEVTSDSVSKGMAYLASSYHPNRFDNLRITPAR